MCDNVTYIKSGAADRFSTARHSTNQIFRSNTAVSRTPPLTPPPPQQHEITSQLPPQQHRLSTCGMTMAVMNKFEDEIPVGLYLLRRIRELGCKTVQGLPGTLLDPVVCVSRVLMNG